MPATRIGPDVSAMRVIRSKKARLTKGRCPLCHSPLKVGTRIVLVPTVGWCHAKCFDQQRRPMFLNTAELLEKYKNVDSAELARSHVQRFRGRPLPRSPDGSVQLELESW